VGPEHSFTYEVGVKFDGPRMSVQVIEFWTDLQDNILRENIGGSDFIRANFDTYINGTELVGEYLLDDTWSVYGNFWYIYGRDRVREEPFSRIPPTQGIVGVRWRALDRCSWFDAYTWLVRRQDRYAEQNLTDSRFPVGGTPGYGTLNLRAGTTLGDCDQHRLSLTLENITDKAYRVLGSGVDGPGFNAILGYEYTR
jgi:outer membrane receptor for ferrienterochelin and colicin